MSGKYFDYGTGSKPKFKRVKGGRKKPKKSAKATRARNKFNKEFNYFAAPVKGFIPPVLKNSDYRPHAKHKKKKGLISSIFSAFAEPFK